VDRFFLNHPDLIVWQVDHENIWLLLATEQEPSLTMVRSPLERTPRKVSWSNDPVLKVRDRRPSAGGTQNFKRPLITAAIDSGHQDTPFFDLSPRNQRASDDQPKEYRDQHDQRTTWSDTLIRHHYLFKRREYRGVLILLNSRLLEFGAELPVQLEC
jgi:hypothetical protein